MDTSSGSGMQAHDPTLLPAPAGSTERGVDPALAVAYAASWVQVRTSAGAWTVRPLLDVAPDAAPTAAFPPGVLSLSVVTACNPRSRRMTPPENAARDLALRQRLDELGLAWWPALNRAAEDAPGGGYPVPDATPSGHGAWDEPSVALHDLPIEDGIALARDLDQAAFHVWTPGRLALVWVPPTGRVTADQRAATAHRRPA